MNFNILNEIRQKKKIKYKNRLAIYCDNILEAMVLLLTAFIMWKLANGRWHATVIESNQTNNRIQRIPGDLSISVLSIFSELNVEVIMKKMFAIWENEEFFSIIFFPLKSHWSIRCYMLFSTTKRVNHTLFYWTAFFCTKIFS